MPTGISTSNILQPGAISIPGGINRALVSSLQLLTPASYNKYTEKYGNEDFTWFLSTFGGMEKADNRNFFWFENRGKLMEAITTASTSTSTLGSTATTTLSPGDHFNSGTQSPLRVGETLRTAIGNIEIEILTINTSVAGAFTFTWRPKQVVTLTITSGDVLLFGGIMDVGERSGTNDPLIHLDTRYDNDITEMRDTFSATDLAEMTKVYYDGSGISGSEPVGGSQAGYSMFTYKGLVKTNMRFKNYVEAKLMRGDRVTNTGLNGTNSVGTQGFTPKILQDGEIVGYTPGNIDISKMHEITRIMDVNGCAKDNMWLTDIFQRQDFSDGLFQAYPAGAYVWGSNENSEEATIAYGVDALKMDGYMFKVKKYSQFNTEVTTGKTPSVDFFRSFGHICPMGTTRDARNSSKEYKNIQIMYQEPPKGGTHGNGIRVWQHGGGSENPTNGTMQDNVEMITYRAIRVTGANQFLTVKAL